MKVEFLKYASTELLQAVDFYNSESEGLGYEFASEVKSTIERITSFPNAWSSISNRTQRCRTKRFPYGIVYQIRKDWILMVAIMRMVRKPDYWKDRIIFPRKYYSPRS